MAADGHLGMTALSRVILTSDIVRKLMPQVEQRFECNAVYGENDDTSQNVDEYGNHDDGDDSGKTIVTLMIKMKI